MNPRFLSAYVIDQDEAQARAVAALLKGGFSKVFFESNLAKAPADCLDLKPAVIFINLYPNQRARSLELLQELVLLSDKTIFFGLLESHEPETVAHALEMGVDDIFVRPFDLDIITTKLSRLVQMEKASGHELPYTPLRPLPDCDVILELRLAAIDEGGLHFRSPHYISRGTSFPLSSPLVEEIFGEKEIWFIISRTSLEPEEREFLSYAEPNLLTEKATASLRRFLLEKKR